MVLVMVLVIVALSIVARPTSEGGLAVVVVRVLVHEARRTLRPVQGEVVVVEHDLRQPEVLQQVFEAFEAHDSIVAILVEDLAQEVLVLAVALGRFLGLQAGHRAQYAEEDVAPETHRPVTMSAPMTLGL
uniref:Putative secreted protein n=1 Tax=Ixodes ricinus TaxID=34613 RepID=A0A6B0UR37_IXORI